MASGEKPVEQAGKLRARKVKHGTKNPQINLGAKYLAPQFIAGFAESKKTQKGLKELSVSIMENAYIAILLIDRNYKILMVNRAVSVYFHKPACEFIGRECFREFEKRGSICPHCPGTRAMANGQPAEAQAEGVRDDGSRFLVRIQAFPTIEPDGAVTGFITIVEDITERKKAEEQLEKSKDLLEKTFLSLDSALFILDAENPPTILDCNPATTKIFGYEKNQMLGRTTEFLHVNKDMLMEFQRVLYSAIEQQDFLSDFEFRMKRENGQVFVTEHSVLPLKDDRGSRTGWVSIVRDITERKHAEEALRESEEKYRDLFENAQEGIITIDLKARITSANKLVEEYGFKRKDLIGKELFDFVPEYDRARAVSDFEILVSGKALKGQMNVITPRGIITVEYRDNPIVRQGQVIGVQAILTDITERKRAEQLVRKERDKAQKYLDVAAVMLVAIDSEQRVGLINKKGCEILGYSEDEILGKNWFVNFLPERVRGQVMAVFDRVMNNEADGPEYYENPVLAKDGQERLIAWHNTILRDEKGEVIATLSSGEDITEQIKAKKEIENLARFPSENPYPVMRISNDDTVLYANSASIELLRDNQSGIGQPAPKQWQQWIKKALETGSVERREVEHAGRVFALRAAPIKNAHYVNLYGVDITDRKKAERQLTQMLAWQEAIFEGSRDAVFITDENSRFVAVNRAACELTGYSKEELLRMRIPDLHKPEDLTAYNLYHDRIMAGEEIVSEAKILRKDGTKVDTEFNNRCIRISGKPCMHTVARDVTERKKAEQKLREHEARLKSLASQLTLAEERERRRIATELHDRIGQSLAVSKIKLDGLRHSVSPQDPVKVMEQVSSSLGQAIADIRSLTFDLSSPILHELGFEAAVAAWLTDQIEQKHGIATEFEDDEQAKPLDDDIRAILFRNVRELLFNVIKHANAHKVKVSIRRIGSRIRVSVQDDGIGFDATGTWSTTTRKGGFGLFSIRERLEQLGGHLHIDSAPGRGCTVTMTAPIKNGGIVDEKI